MKSQCDLILDVLSDGKPHLMQEIHRRVGFCRLNSRVAELRKRGHVISCDKRGGLYRYRLHGSAVEASADAAPVGDLADRALPTIERTGELERAPHIPIEGQLDLPV